MLEIDEANDSVVDAIALVEHPAIEENFLRYRREIMEQLKFIYNIK